MLRSIRAEVTAYVETFLASLPGASGVRLRRWYWRSRFRTLGPDAVIGRQVLIGSAMNISIGREFSCWRYCTLVAGDGTIEAGTHVTLNSNVYINAASGGRIVIGNDVAIGPNTVMRAASKSMSPDLPMSRQPNVGLQIVIGNDVWFGANVTVVGGVTIGAGAVVAAGAVVTRDVPAMAVVAGVPARVVRLRGARDASETLPVVS